MAKQQSIQQYQVLGRVIDRVSRQGVQGMRVEGWDRDTRFHDLLGSSLTDSNGSFSFRFDSDYFGDYGGDYAPDLFFKVYLGDTVIKSTFDTPMKNQPAGDTRVTIEIDYAQAAPTGTDRVATDQAVKAVRFVKQSDFAGLWREGGAKLATVGQFARALGKNAIFNFDFEPIGPKGPSNNEVAGQDVATAQRNLAANQVNVAEVKDYDPQADASSIRAIADFPLNLKSGDSVKLYQHNGKVQYYSIVKPVATATLDANTVVRIDQDVQALKSDMVDVHAIRTELATVKANNAQSSAQIEGDVATVKAGIDQTASLKAQLAVVQQSAADKDAQIIKLQSDLSNIQTAQKDINTRFSAEKLAALEQQVQQLVQANRGGVAQPVGAAPAATPALPNAAKTRTTTTKPKAKAKAKPKGGKSQ